LPSDKNDLLYVLDSQSSETPGAANYNHGAGAASRIGSVKDGKVMYFIPPPVPPDPKMQPPIGICGRRQWRDLRKLRRPEGHQEST